jgi:hypothetical protein
MEEGRREKKRRREMKRREQKKEKKSIENPCEPKARFHKHAQYPNTPTRVVHNFSRQVISIHPYKTPLLKDRYRIWDLLSVAHVAPRRCPAPCYAMSLARVLHACVACEPDCSALGPSTEPLLYIPLRNFHNCMVNALSSTVAFTKGHRCRWRRSAESRSKDLSRRKLGLGRHTQLGS